MNSPHVLNYVTSLDVGLRESSNFYAPTGSEHKFDKAWIENRLPILFELGLPCLETRTYNHWLKTRWMEVPHDGNSQLN